MRIIQLLSVLLVCTLTASGGAQTFSFSDIQHYLRGSTHDLLVLRSGESHAFDHNQLTVDMNAQTLTIQGKDKEAEFVSSWRDAAGVSHTVRTPYDSSRPHLITQAITHHGQAVRAMQSMWPPG